MTSMAAVPRVSAGQRRFPNLPVIEHPMSRMSNRDDLAVLGSARGLRAGQFGKISFQDPGSGAREPAPISANRASAPERILQWPPGKNHSSRESGGCYRGREGGGGRISTIMTTIIWAFISVCSH